MNNQHSTLKDDEIDFKKIGGFVAGEESNRNQQNKTRNNQESLKSCFGRKRHQANMAC